MRTSRGGRVNNLRILHWDPRAGCEGESAYSEGQEVVYVPDAERARAHLGREPFDACVLAVEDPDRAAEALTLLASLCPDLPVIALTPANGQTGAEMPRGVTACVARGDAAGLRAALEALRSGAPPAQVRPGASQERREALLADEMISLGLLAAGVGHEVNNPLGVILANLRHLSREIEAILGGSTTGVEGAVETERDRLAGLREALEDALEAATRIQRIVADLRLFSQHRSAADELVDLREILHLSLRLVFNEIRHRARLVEELEAVPPVAGSPRRLAELTIGLLAHVTSLLEVGAADAHEVRVRLERAGEEVALTVTASGPSSTGRAAAAGERERGSLALCRRIARDLGARLEEGVNMGPPGRWIRVTLAVAAPQPEPAPATAASADVAHSPRPLSVLVVDDDALVARALERILSPRHRVRSVGGGREALDEIEAHHYDVVFCDVMMPNMTGVDLYQEIARRHPPLAEAVVFMTAGVFSESARSFLSDPAHLVLRKPFEPYEVEDVLARAHARRRASGEPAPAA